MIPVRRTLTIAFWVVVAASIGAAVWVFHAIARGEIGYMPELEELSNPINRYASQIITDDGEVIGTWSRSENRIFTAYDSISPNLINALIATEDIRFYEHSGVDARSLIRAIVKRGLMGQKNAGGGSTITQQLAKQLYSATAATTQERMMQKPIEWVIATELERMYTKEEIITHYLNHFDFLYNAVGIHTAAQVYFNKRPSQLSVTESATLVGMCKNPSYYNPVRFTERCRERRNVVLKQMNKAGYISDDEYARYAQEPLALDFHRPDHKTGKAPYLREYLRRIMTAHKPERSKYASWQYAQYYSDSIAWETDPLYGWCHKNKKADGTSYDIYTDGLKIYTTINARMQQYAEEACYNHVALYLQPLFDREKKGNPTAPYSSALTTDEVNTILHRAIRQSERYRAMKASGSTDEEIQHAFRTPVKMSIFSYKGVRDTTMTPLDSIRYYKSFLRTGLLSLDAQTGYVKAYVGGLNYTYFQYDMAIVGRRQVGSTMKPFVYALAMEDGRRPTDEIVNIQRTYKVGLNTWTPRNSSTKRYGESVTLRWGLSQSNNWVTAELMYRVDPSGHRLANLLREFGVVNPDIHPSLSLCLGSCDITVAEQASSFTAFANRGIRSAPILVSRIEDSAGNIIARFMPKQNEVISENSAYEMLDMLQAVVNEGTGGRLRFRYGFTAAIAGKTGTTNRNSDGWFVGVTPKLVTACWVGGEDRDIHFNSMTNGQGASSALPIWALYMKEVYADPTLPYKQTDQFLEPTGERDYGLPEDSLSTEEPAEEQIAPTPPPAERESLNELFN